MAQGQEHRDAPIPGRLTDQSPGQKYCFQDTQTLLGLCQELGCVVNLKKSELEPKQVINSAGYQYDLTQGMVRPTQRGGGP